MNRKMIGCTIVAVLALLCMSRLSTVCHADDSDPFNPVNSIIGGTND